MKKALLIAGSLIVALASAAHADSRATPPFQVLAGQEAECTVVNLLALPMKINIQIVGITPAPQSVILGKGAAGSVAQVAVEDTLVYCVFTADLLNVRAAGAVVTENGVQAIIAAQ